MNSLFPQEPPLPQPARLPPGFRYHREFLSPAQEQELLEQLGGLALRHSRYREYTALRRTASFRLPAASCAGHNPDAPPAPEFLTQLALQVAQFVGRDPGLFPHLLVTQYPPGAPMGWHRDAPPYSVIYGVSLGSDCRFGLRPHEAAAVPLAADKRGRGHPRHQTTWLTAERRSLYVLAGPARSDWQHCIAPLKALRYSVTLRTLS